MEHFQNVPKEMKGYPHWLVWKLIDKGGEKPSKVPFSVHGGAAAVNDSATWGTFKEAASAYEVGQYDGIGFVFTGTPFVGIDIDGCIDQETGEIAHEANDIIKTANSYTELSQSGKGFHIIMQGKLPDGRRRSGQFEMYGNGSPRYFAMTGNLWGECAGIAENQDAIDAVHQKYIAKQKQENHTKGIPQQTAYLEDEQLITAAAAARNGGAFSALYNGDWRSEYNSQSEADIAFCNMLAFWTGCNDEQMDRIFRSSGLMREKWDEKHGLLTYGEITITKACDDCTKVYEPTTREKTKIYSGSNGEKTVDLDQFHKFSSKGCPTGVYDSRIVDYIIGSEHIFIMGDIPYLYEKGVYYIDIRGNKVKAKIQKLLYEEVRTAKVINGIYNLLLMQDKLQKTYDEINCHPKYWINFKNGMLDPKTKELHPHRPEYFSINQIPWVYNPEKGTADYPASTRFLETSLDPEDVKTIFQFMGLCLTVETAFQYFLVLLGEGGNGKSLLISVVERLTGKENVSNIAMQELSQRFQGARLFGKLLNACADIPTDLLEDDSVIKKLTGGDTITREYKGRDATEFVPYAKYLFSANRFPYVGDKSDGFMRRLRVIVMDKKPQIPDVRLKEKLFNEMDFWIIKAVDGLRELLETNTLTESQRSMEKRQVIEKKNNSVVAFINECLCPLVGHNIKRSDAYKEYVEYCAEQGRTPSGKTNFFEEMEAKGYTASVLKGCYIYRNIAFSVWKESELSEGYAALGT